MQELIRKLREGERDGLLDEFEQYVKGTINSVSNSFTNDHALKRFQGSEDLYQIALIKLDKCIKRFEYDDTYDEETNQKRFMGLFRTAITNAFIDEQYLANLQKRSPKTGSVSIDGDSEDEDLNYREIIPDTIKQPYEYASTRELIALLRSNFQGEDLLIFDHIVKGHHVDYIARKTGLNSNRIRYVLYSKIQPVAKRILS